MPESSHIGKAFSSRSIISALIFATSSLGSIQELYIFRVAVSVDTVQNTVLANPRYLPRC